MISIICATRGRPHFMKQMWESAHNTAKYKDTLEVIFYIDEDDTPSLNVINELGPKYEKNGESQTRAVTGPRYCMPLSNTVNISFPYVRNDIMLLAGDDIIFKTEGWDAIVKQLYDMCPDKLIICGGDDGLNKELITHPFIHRRWAEVVGRVVPGFFRDMYVDTWLNDVANMCGRLVRLPILIEHNHYSKTGKMDQTSQERMAKVNEFDESGHLYYTTKEERILEAQKIIGAMDD